MGTIVSIDYSLDAADPDGIATSQTPLAAGDLTLDGALVVDGVAILATDRTQRRIEIASVGNDSGRTFTIIGENADGTKIGEQLAGGNAGAVQSVRDYTRVTRISVDGATAGAVSAGTNSVGATPWIVLDRHRNPFAVGFGITVDGTVTYQPQHTFDNVQVLNAPPPDVFTNDGAPFNPAPGATTSQDGNVAFPVAAFRVQINSGDGTLRIRVIQAGIRGG